MDENIEDEMDEDMKDCDCEICKNIRYHRDKKRKDKIRENILNLLERNLEKHSYEKIKKYINEI